MNVQFRLGTLRFTWDAQKYRTNVLKHEVTFEEAATTWLDAEAQERPDDSHSSREDRWLRIGLSLRGALLVAWYSVRDLDGEELIRIIGARRATRNEWRLYEEEKV